MDFAILLTVVFLIMFLVLAILLLRVLCAPEEKHDLDHALLPQSKYIHTPWRNVVFKMLVMRPWPYKDLWNPLNRLYWPDEQANNRTQRRQSRRKRNR